MTNSPNTMNPSDVMLAELLALSASCSFDWLVPAPFDEEQMIADTHAEQSASIEEMRQAYACEFDRCRVTFVRGTDGVAIFAHTDVRSEKRRSAQP